MEVFANLFDDWVGLLSLGVVLFITGMAVFFPVVQKQGFERRLMSGKGLVTTMD